MSTPESDRFEAACRAWQSKLGLTDWAFRFKVEEEDSAKYAQVAMDHEARLATFTYYKGEQVDEPERVALHEVLHVLLNELLEIAILRCHTEHRDVDREEHRVIERLLNVLP